MKNRYILRDWARGTERLGYECREVRRAIKGAVDKRGLSGKEG